MIEIRGLKQIKYEKYNKIIIEGEKYKWNWVLNNQNLLKHYRELAKKIYKGCFSQEDLADELYNDEKFNSFIFSVIQYRVSSAGRDKKVEKLRALYSLSRTLMFCYMLLPIGNIVLCKIQNNEERGCTFIIVFVCICLALLFFFRAKKCKKYMALIMLGNYDAIQSNSADKNSKMLKEVVIISINNST